MNQGRCRGLRTPWLALAPALVLLTVMALSPAVAADGVSVTTGSTEVDVGETADIPVQVMGFVDSAGMGGYDFEVSFTPGVIEVLDVRGGDPPFDRVMAYHVNNDEGWVRFNAVQGTEVPGPTGDFIVAYLKVKGTGEPGASTDLALTIRGFIDTEGDPVTAALGNGEVTVAAAPPLNGDEDAARGDRLRVLAPWIALGVAVIAAVAIFARRRRA